MSGVFDSETLALLQQWRARALLPSIAVSADGTFVYAAGAQGFDVNGRQRPWPASVTVYDAETGEEIADSELTAVHLDTAARRAVPFPSDILARL